MSCELHIIRADKIDLAEWAQLVSKTHGVRCSQISPTVVGMNREVVSLNHHSGDVDAYFANESSWRMVFRFSSSGEITFKAPVDWEDSESVVRKLATAMAEQLNAQIVGDEGEVYFG